MCGGDALLGAEEEQEAPHQLAGFWGFLLPHLCSWMKLRRQEPGPEPLHTSRSFILQVPTEVVFKCQTVLPPAGRCLL